MALAQAVGLVVAGHEVAKLARRNPATLSGPGKVRELAERVEEGAIGVVVVDAALTPVQQRNLERALRAKVIDRTALILEIFGERARTREGRLQVELAALTYQLSRLVRSWTHLERQRGGYGFLGGPGESQIEADRRHIRERITRIRQSLAQVVRTRAIQRRARRRRHHPVVALVGYTNAGKSTLFNRLTRAGVIAEDKLFATLDPTMRGVALPSGRRVILSDTVGFIADLPPELVAAFRATLEEVVEADLLLHLIDVSHPEAAAQRDDVRRVLEALAPGAELVSRVIEVHNKIDRLAPERRAGLARLLARRDDAAAISAVTGQGIGRLLALIDRRLADSRELFEVCIAAEDGATLAWLYRRGQVVERHDDGGTVHLRVRLTPEEAGHLRARAEVGRWPTAEHRRASVG